MKSRRPNHVHLNHLHLNHVHPNHVRPNLHGDSLRGGSLMLRQMAVADSLGAVELEEKHRLREDYPIGGEQEASKRYLVPPIGLMRCYYLQWLEFRLMVLGLVSSRHSLLRE